MQKTVLTIYTWVLTLICFYNTVQLSFSLSNNSVSHNYSEKLKGCYKKEYQVTSQKESLRLLNSKQHHLMMLIHYGTVYCFANRRKFLLCQCYGIESFTIYNNNNNNKFGHILGLSDLFVISIIVLLFFLQIFITNANILVSGLLLFLNLYHDFFNLYQFYCRESSQF